MVPHSWLFAASSPGSSSQRISRICLAPYKCPRWLGYIGIPFCLIVAFCSLYSAVTAGTLFYIAVAFFVIAMLYYAAVCKKKNGTLPG